MPGIPGISHNTFGHRANPLWKGYGEATHFLPYTLDAVNTVDLTSLQQRRPSTSQGQGELLVGTATCTGCTLALWQEPAGNWVFAHINATVETADLTSPETIERNNAYSGRVVNALTQGDPEADPQDSPLRARMHVNLSNLPEDANVSVNAGAPGWTGWVAMDGGGVPTMYVRYSNDQGEVVTKKVIPPEEIDGAPRFEDA